MIDEPVADVVARVVAFADALDRQRPGRRDYGICTDAVTLAREVERLQEGIEALLNARRNLDKWTEEDLRALLAPTAETR